MTSVRPSRPVLREEKTDCRDGRSMPLAVDQMEGKRPASDLRKAIGSVDRNRALLERASSLVYRQNSTRSLLVHVFQPPGSSPRDERPAMLFFHGSLWDKGLVSQFAPHAYAFAQRGLVSLLFEYRLQSTDATGAVEVMEDVAEAHRWVQGHAGLFGIDRNRCVSCGASGGAWAVLAWTLGLMVLKPEERPAPLPAALVLYEPACEIGPKLPGFSRFPDKKTAASLNPFKLLRKDPPPAIILQGTQDAVLPFASTARFAKAWRSKKGRCDLIPYEGAGHGFHNFNMNARLYENCLNAVDAFLVSLGLLEAVETLVAF